MDAIKDMDSYYWFMDAVMDIELYMLNNDVEAYVTRMEDVLGEHTSDYETQRSFASQGSGRYKFGQSLFSPYDIRSCSNVGGKTCPCN